MKVRGKLPAISLLLIDVEFPKLVAIHENSEPRVLKSEEKSLWLSEQNFTDQVVLVLQLLNTQERKVKQNHLF